MADNDFEYHAEDLAKRKAQRDHELQQRRNRYLKAYQKMRKASRRAAGPDKADA